MLLGFLSFGPDTAKALTWTGPPNEVAAWLEPAHWVYKLPEDQSPENFFHFVIDNGGTAHLDAGSVVGHSGVLGEQLQGQLLQTDGSLTLESLELGKNTGSAGQYDLVGGEATMILEVGSNGIGEFNFSGGILTTPRLRIASEEFGQGVVHHSGGLLQGTPKDSQASIKLGSTRGTRGDYFLSGTGQIQIPWINLYRGSFLQSGGAIDLEEGLSLTGGSWGPTLYHLQQPEGRIYARSISLKGFGEESQTQFRQDGGTIESKFISIKHGQYFLDGGTINAESLTVDTTLSASRTLSAPKFIQSGGKVHLTKELRVSDDSDSRGWTSTALYELRDGVVDVNFLKIYSASSAIFHQLGGTVHARSVEVTGDRNRSTAALYHMEGGQLHIENQLQVANGGTSQHGGFDFSGQALTLSTGYGSYLNFGPNATIAGGENTTLRIGSDSLLVTPEGFDLESLFGTVEHDNVVVHHPGQTLQVAANQSVQIGGVPKLQDGMVVEGRVWVDPARGDALIVGQMNVQATGNVDLGQNSGWIVPSGNNNGLFGGQVTLGNLVIKPGTGPGRIPATVTVADGGSLTVHNSIRVEESGSGQIGKFVVLEGQVSARSLTLSGKDGHYLQRGGEVAVQDFTLEDKYRGAKSRGDLTGGVLKTNKFTLEHGAVFQQTGGLIETNHLLLDTNASYFLRGGKLNILSQLGWNRIFAGPNPPSRDFPKIDFRNSSAEISVKGAILDLSRGNLFRNAKNATIGIDEHSLTILKPGINLEALFGTYDNAGMTLRVGQNLVIPADREIHGIMNLENLDITTEIYGKLIADEGGGIFLGHFLVRPGAEVDLGLGSAVSYPVLDQGEKDLRSGISGGTLRASGMTIASGPNSAFLHTGGDATFGTIRIDKGGEYRLTGGSLTIGHHMNKGTINFDGSPTQLRLGEGASMQFQSEKLRGMQILNSQNATLVGGRDSLFVVGPGYNLHDEFQSFSTEGLIDVFGETLVVPAGHSVVGDLTLFGGITNRGIVSPGHSPGQIVIHRGDYRQEPEGRLVIEIGREPFQQGHDNLYVYGNAWLDGILDVRLIDGFVPGGSKSYKILNSNTIHGLFANAKSTVDVLGGGTFDVLYKHDAVVLANYRAAVIPEPSTASLAAVFFLVGGLRARRQKKMCDFTRGSPHDAK